MEERVMEAVLWLFAGMGAVFFANFLRKIIQTFILDRWF